MFTVFFVILIWSPKRILRSWFNFSEHSKIPISPQVIRDHWYLLWVLGVTLEIGPTSLEPFRSPKRFLRTWFNFSEHLKIPISLRVIGIHWCLFWLLGITWETGQTSPSFFEDFTFYRDILCINLILTLFNI